MNTSAWVLIGEPPIKFKYSSRNKSGGSECFIRHTALFLAAFVKGEANDGDGQQP
ncbi:hypothetical protein OK016_24560 [Vibrio chagasii]|nr:hypothetical protein [Vibrio chagasii]